MPCKQMWDCKQIKKKKKEVSRQTPTQCGSTSPPARRKSFQRSWFHAPQTSRELQTKNEPRKEATSSPVNNCLSSQSTWQLTCMQLHVQVPCTSLGCRGEFSKPHLGQRVKVIWLNTSFQHQAEANHPFLCPVEYKGNCVSQCYLVLARALWPVFVFTFPKKPHIWAHHFWQQLH